MSPEYFGIIVAMTAISGVLFLIGMKMRLDAEIRLQQGAPM